MEADDLDAAVLAADERLADLFSDLRSLVARSDAERKEAAGSRRSDAGKMTASTDWDELLGCDKESVDDEDACSLDECPSRGRLPEAKSTRLVFSADTDSPAAEETTTATRDEPREESRWSKFDTSPRCRGHSQADWGALERLHLRRRTDTVPERGSDEEFKREMNLLLERRRQDALSSTAAECDCPGFESLTLKSAADDVVHRPEFAGDGMRFTGRYRKQAVIRASGWGGGRNRQGTSPPLESYGLGGRSSRKAHLLV